MRLHMHPLAHLDLSTDHLPSVLYVCVCVLARSALVHCPGCGKPKLAHHLCEYCFGQINRWQKLEFGRSNKERDALLNQIGQLPIVPETGKPQLSSSQQHQHQHQQQNKIEPPTDGPTQQ